MSDTLRLLRTIGSPFVPDVDPPRTVATDLYTYARNNRLPLLYLSALRKWGKLGNLAETYRDRYERSLGTFDAIARASAVLGAARIPYVLFKTIRPYRETTVDIDVIIRKSQREHARSVEWMLRSGYVELGAGPNSTTVKHPSERVAVDLYCEVAVSQIIYLDKRDIGPYITEVDVLPGKAPVRTLSPLADIIALIAHSLIKEHMYTLSEYYSTLFFLEAMSASEVGRFIEVVRQSDVVRAVQVHLGLTATLHKAAHGFVPPPVARIVDRLGSDDLEIRRSLRGRYATPHKFHPITIARTLFEKITNDRMTRRSVVKQIRSMFDPQFSMIVFKEILRHITREGY